jgi:hypothetical protein
VPLQPSLGPAAAEPDACPDAGQASAPGGEPDARLDARYEQLRHAALHARARAFPLGFGVLIGKGVTAWRRLVSRLAQWGTIIRSRSLTCCFGGSRDLDHLQLERSLESVNRTLKLEGSTIAFLW